MQNILDERRLLLSTKKDKIILCGSLLGNYSVKLGYNILAKINSEAFTSKALCWNKDILPKARSFAWLAYNGRILTAERLRKIGIIGSYRLCEKNKETIDNLLVQYKNARKCWDFVQFKLG